MTFAQLKREWYLQHGEEIPARVAFHEARRTDPMKRRMMVFLDHLSISGTLNIDDLAMISNMLRAYEQEQNK